MFLIFFSIFLPSCFLQLNLRESFKSIEYQLYRSSAGMNAALIHGLPSAPSYRHAIQTEAAVEKKKLHRTVDLLKEAVSNNHEEIIVVNEPWSDTCAAHDMLQNSVYFRIK